MTWGEDQAHCIVQELDDPIACWIHVILHKIEGEVGIRRKQFLSGQAMALSEFEAKRYEKIIGQFVEQRRPPPHMRDKLNLGFRVQGQSIEIFEIRPVWRDPDKKMESPVAKATYVKTSDTWKVFWQRADLKWHRYEPNSEVETLEEFLAVVEKDEYACFWG